MSRVTAALLREALAAGGGRVKIARDDDDGYVRAYVAGQCGVALSVNAAIDHALLRVRRSR